MTDRGMVAVPQTPSAVPAESYSHTFALHAFGDVQSVGTGLQGSGATDWVYHPQPAIAWPGLATAVIFGPW
jgi:hypothetical protein